MVEHRLDSHAVALGTDPSELASTRLFPQNSMVVPAQSGAEQKAGAAESSASEVLVQALEALGVVHAFAVFGGSIAPFCEALSRSRIRLLHCRHEAGAAFAAIESSLASGRPAVVVSTSGPGVTNLITGMVAARWEGARVIFISGHTAPPNRGKWAFQECGGAAPEVDIYRSGSVFHLAQVLEDPCELQSVIARLTSGVARPNGFVAHLGVPVSLQVARTQSISTNAVTISTTRQCDDAIVADCASRLSGDPFVIWIGAGARHAAQEVRDLAERAQAMVMSSPRGKGIFSEDNPQCLGVTGLGGYGAIEAYFAAARPLRLLVLGTRLGEMTSFWEEALVPSREIIHVDLDAQVFGTAYSSVPTLGVQAEIGTFLRALLDAWPDRSRTEYLVSARSVLRTTAVPRTGGPIRPSFLMQEIQREVVEKSDAVVLTEAGNAFTLGTHHLRFAEPGRYRVSTGFGSMGHACAGVLGAAVGTGRRAVAIVGDGAMLMQNELNTAATYGIDATWIVLNDARYGMIAQGMSSVGWTPFETDFARANFVEIARGMGASGIRVEDEADVADALRSAMRAKGPFVVDVVIDPSELAPAGRRNKSLRAQGVGRGSR